MTLYQWHIQYTLALHKLHTASWCCYSFYILPNLLLNNTRPSHILNKAHFVTLSGDADFVPLKLRYSVAPPSCTLISPTGQKQKDRNTKHPSSRTPRPLRSRYFLKPAVSWLPSRVLAGNVPPLWGFRLKFPQVLAYPIPGLLPASNAVVVLSLLSPMLNTIS